MIKKLGIILSAAALVLTLSACSKEKEAGFVEISDKTCDFKFAVPEAFENTSQSGILSATVLKDVSKASITGFSFGHGLEAEPTAFDYWSNHYEAQLSDTYKNVEVVREEETVLGGENVARAEYVITIGDEKFDCDIMLAVYGGKVYTLTLTQGQKTEAMGENYTDYTSVFEETLKTFKIG